LRELRSRRRGSRKKKGSGAGFLVFLFFFLLLLAGAAAAWFVFLPAGPQGETFVEIAPGSGSNQIATQLEQAGVVRSRYAFDLVRLWKRGRLKAGEYRFDQAAPVTEVYARIARGDVYTLPVTIPEGANRFDIAVRMVQAGFLNVNKEDFLAATISETPLIADLDPQARSLEGYLFPDTYRFPRKVTSAQIINAMVRRFRTVASELDLTHPPTQTADSRSVHSVVTLASLVERETAVSSERPLVASVLSNRLAKKMPLMTDPAVIYGLEVKDQWRGAIYQSDLSDPKHDTPYNTYRHIGLPPGPIANPGLASLRAAMNPAATDYLYFVAAGADPQGKSRFASTLDEHNKNVASYRKAVRQAGGR
jgi:UPF0755 protein